MPDPRFFETAPPLAPQDAAALLGAVLERDGAARIARAAAIDGADLADGLVFVETKKDAAALGGRDVALCIAPAGVDVACAGALLRAPAPKYAFAMIAQRLHRPRTQPDSAGVDRTARLGPEADVHPTAVIGAGAKIGARAAIGPFAVVGAGVEIGDDAEIGAHASIVCALIGARFSAGPGVRIGQAGFGFVSGPHGLVAMPQLGRVLVGDDVRIGANAAIDRGGLADTAIGDGVKIDNLVHIAHNVRIGAGAIIVAQVGVAGSTTIGAGAILGGQAGIADHVAIGDGAQVAARGGVMRDIPPGEKWGGAPARPVRQWFRETAALERLAKNKRTDGDA